jgi:hypothetical protein
MRLLVIMLACAAAATPSAAAVLGTLQQASAGYDVVSFNSWQASSFTLADNAGTYRVRQVKLHLAQIMPNANLILRITGSKFGRPDNADVRAELQIPASLPVTAGAVNFEASASPDPLLVPGQTYWLVLGISALDLDEAQPAGLVRWSYAATSAADAPSAAGWSIGNNTASSGTNGSDWQASANTPYLFAISARPPSAAVPSAPGINVVGNAIQITARGTPGVNYEIESSNDLRAWANLGSVFADSSGSISFPDGVGVSKKFYRFR